MLKPAIAATLAAGLSMIGAARAEEFKIVRPPEDPYPSTYTPLASKPLLIRDANVLDGRGGETIGVDIAISNGRIVGLGKGLAAPAGADVIEARGRWVTAGIIDMHSHLGVYASPGVAAHSDGNEATRPASPEVWAEHSVWPQDPGFARAMAGGVTSLMILPGSANLFGGRSVTLKNVPARTVQGMKFPGAPYGLKMACGENPKRVYGEKGGPATRMGNMAGYRAQWIKAENYKRKWDEYWQKAEAFKEGQAASGRRNEKPKEPPSPPERDLGMETLSDVLRGKISIQMHCYRADEMALILDLAKEFNYKVAAFHHAVESYKIADMLAKEGVCSAMWADWWGFKLEAWDGVQENIALVHRAGACAVVHSDSAQGIQRLNQEAAKAMADGRRLGIPISRGEAWSWLSLNPARAIGIDKETGSLEPGKAADLVLWSADPLSVYAKADRVYVDGAVVFDRADAAKRPLSDFEVGLHSEIGSAP